MKIEQQQQAKDMKNNPTTTNHREICPFCGNEKIRFEGNLEMFPEITKIRDVADDLVDHEITFITNFVNRRNIVGRKISKSEIFDLGRPFIIKALESDRSFSNLGDSLRSFVVNKLRKNVNLNKN